MRDDQSLVHRVAQMRPFSTDSRMGSCRGGGGFTLIELMVTIAVLAILAGLAAPSFSAMLADTRRSASINEFLGVLALSRSEAIKRGRRITMCTSIDQSTCAINVGWHRGWIAFEDMNENADREAGETLLAADGALPGGITVTGNALPVRDYVSYVSTGMPRKVDGGFLAGTITLCSGGTARTIVISSAGRARVAAAGGC